MNVLDGLDDAVFAESTDFLAGLASRLESSLGRKPTIAEFLELLAASLQLMNGDLFEDVSPNAVRALLPQLEKRPRKTAPGMLLAVPLNTRWRFVLYLGSNRFGDALGILGGSGRTPTNVPEVLVPHGKPVYSSLREVRSGRWRVTACRPDLMSLFPSMPEIYHAKTGLNLENTRIGEFGSAESPDGRLRQIDSIEARDVGLLDGRYRQVLQPDEVERCLLRSM
ncbi:MAG: hypothetical protein IT186_24625 [Acidobacteria bacterium]|nr:hypothetical protein [Acidobacteriota bacterium]MCG3193406.1 hypothetical protein [Thermoanaerobaculia bacterium]